MTKTLRLPKAGIDICYRETGIPDAPAALLMHGWGCNHTTLASVADAFPPSMRLIIPDLPGFGATPEPPAVWGVEQYTLAMEEMLDLLGIKNPVLLGHSFGGRISLLMASRRPVSKIILVDAAGVKPQHSLSWYVKVYSFKLAKRLYPLLLGKRRAQEKIEAARRARASADYAQASPRMRAILSRCVGEDLKGVMPSIKAPTLLIWGEKDTATPLRDAKIMERRIPDAGLVSFPGAGHYSFLDNPGQFRAVIQAFLKEHM